MLDKYTDDFAPFNHLIEPRETRSLIESSINPQQLTAYQRALLILDGTVTQFIEAYSLESIHVVRLNQTRRVLQAPHAWLEAEADTEVLAREVILQGHPSGTVYVHAVSLLVISRLPETLLAQFETDSGGIGRILLSSRIENRRELLWFGHEQISEMPPQLVPHLNNDFLSRYYRVMISGTPVMLINEKFPRYLGYPPGSQSCAP
ncbi:MAG: chorismate--pyruvate lyase family protein [Methylococcaceae bacterium]